MHVKNMLCHRLIETEVMHPAVGTDSSDKREDGDWVGIARLCRDKSLYSTLTALLILNGSPEASFDTRLLAANNSPSAAKVWLAQDHRQLQVKLILPNMPAKSKQKPHLHKAWFRADPRNGGQGWISQSSAKSVLQSLEEHFFFPEWLVPKTLCNLRDSH